MTMYLKLQENYASSTHPNFRIIEIPTNTKFKTTNSYEMKLMDFYLLSLYYNDNIKFHLFYESVLNENLEDFNLYRHERFVDYLKDDVVNHPRFQRAIEEADDFDINKEYQKWCRDVKEAIASRYEIEPNLCLYFGLTDFITDDYLTKVGKSDNIEYICEPDNYPYNDILSVDFSDYLSVNSTNPNRVLDTCMYSVYPYFCYENVDIKHFQIGDKHYLSCGKAYLINDLGQTIQKY